MEITGTQQIPILHICSSDKTKSKRIIVDEKLSQVYSTDEGELERVIFNESSMEQSEPESVHKSINTNKEKYAIDKTEDEEPSVTYNPVIIEPRYFNLFECGKKFLNNLDATCECVCMETSNDNYYKKMCNTINYYNNRNNTPSSNAKI